MKLFLRILYTVVYAAMFVTAIPFSSGAILVLGISCCLVFIATGTFGSTTTESKP